MSSPKKSSSCTNLRRASCALSLITLGTADQAHAQVVERFSLIATGRAGVADNPFLLEGSTAAAFLEVELQPRLRFLRELSETSLTGRLQQTQYLQKYSSSSNAEAALRHTSRLSETVTVNAGLVLESAILGEGNFALSPDADPGQGLPDVGVLDPDLPLLGLRQRRNAFRADASVAQRLDEFDKLQAQASAQRSVYPGQPNISNFWSYSAGASYSKALDALSSVGARGSAEYIRYDDGGGTFRIYRPELLYSRRLSEAFEVDAALGVTIVDGRGLAGDTSSVGLAGSINGCYRAPPRHLLCGRINRDAAASGFGGVRSRTDAELTYSYRVSERSTLNLNGKYARYGQGLRLSDPRNQAVGTFEALALGASFERRIKRRLTAGSSLAYRQLSRELRGSTTDFVIAFSLGYRFGSEQ